ncbi:MAG: tetratricopeptide repeat protein [Actinobacteria bacterium]|nr:tetratricopeptide repeat protein [Actinomycetota bacterium]
MEDPAALGRRLQELRKRAGLSQGELAFDGCSAGYVSRIEAGDRVPSLHLVRELADRLGVSEEYLLTGSEGDGVWCAVLVDAEIALRLGEGAEAHDLYGKALGEATSVEVKSEALEGLGHLAAQRGEPRQAIELLERALALTGAEPADRPRLAEALGRAYASLEELAPAIALFRRCLKRLGSDGDAIQYVRFACLLGYALSDLGQFDEAELVVAGALERGRGVTDPYTRSRLLWSQSRLLIEQGKSELAERYAKKTLETLRATEDSYALGHAHQSLAHIYLDLGRPAEAQRILDEGWPLIESAATPLELAHYRIEEARSLAALGQGPRAAELAMTILDRLGAALPVDAGRVHLLLGEIFEGLGEPGRARELYESGVRLLEPHGKTRYLLSGYRRLAASLKRDGRTEQALEVLERALHVQDSAGRVLL